MSQEQATVLCNSCARPVKLVKVQEVTYVVPCEYCLAIERVGGFNEAYATAHADGYASGFDDGYEAGYKAGLDEGREEAYEEGREDGYYQGYEDAIEGHSWE